MKLKSLALVTLLSLSLVGCMKKATSDPTAPTPYGTEAKAVLTIATILHTGANTIDQLHKQGTVSTEGERDALQAMFSLHKLNGDFAACAQTIHKSTDAKADYLACANAFLQMTQDQTFLLSIHVKDDKTQAEVTSWMQSIQGLLQGIKDNLTALTPVAAQ